MKEKECHLLVCRIENLYKLINYYRIQGNNYLANVFFKIADEERKKSINQVILGKLKRYSLRYDKLLLNMRALKTHLTEFLLDFPNIT